MRVTILGCGGSDGVPMVGGPDGRGDWGLCDPTNPRNRRSRASIHVAAGDVGLLIDTAPDLRTQLLETGIGRITHVAYTHDHADHTHGLNELRRLARFMGKRMPVYADAHTLRRLGRRFDYAFEQPPTSPYEAIVEANEIKGPFQADGLAVTPFPQDHGFEQATLGFRIGDFAYSTDVIGFPEGSFKLLEGTRVWIVDCVGDLPHFSHAHWELTLSWIGRLKPERAILTHMGAGLDYETVRRRCPPGVEPGYDGLVVEL